MLETHFKSKEHLLNTYDFKETLSKNNNDIIDIDYNKYIYEINFGR